MTGLRSIAGCVVAGLAVTAIMAGLAGPAAAQSPSFDCDAARSPDELAICSDPDLAEMDVVYARAYDYVRVHVSKSGALKIAKATLKKRRACGDDVLCLETVMARGIAALAEIGAPLTTSEHTERSGPPLPARVGSCARSKIAGIEGRLEGDPDFSSGTAVIFANGGYQVSYDREDAIIGSSVGDPVEICLIRIPKGCPPGDERGRWYSTTNLRTGGQWSLPDAQHQCGGA